MCVDPIAAMVRLRLPDGSVIAPVHPPRVLLLDQRIESDQYFAFTFAWPAPGAYVLQLIDEHDGERPTPQNTVELPFKVG